jgi:LysR family glycine cleavage system transcriptional activator
MALPSLRNLQVFEVAARHPTLRAVADALFLTHGAVSRQIRALEAELGVALFTLTRQGMVLTPQGQRLQASVAQALKLMSDATVTLGQEARSSAAPCRHGSTFLRDALAVAASIGFPLATS